MIYIGVLDTVNFGVKIFEAKATTLDDTHPTAMKTWKLIEGVAWSEKYYEAGITVGNQAHVAFLPVHVPPHI